MRLYELQQKIDELIIRKLSVGDKNPAIRPTDKLLKYSFGKIRFYRCQRQDYLYYIATEDHTTTIGWLELHNDIDKLYNLELRSVSAVLADIKHQGKQIGQQLYYAALEDGVHILSGDTQTPLGAKNLEKIVKAGKYDVMYYDDTTGEVTEEQPVDFFVEGNDTDWKLILAK